MSEKFEAKNIREVCALLATDPDRGLSEKEAAKRHETGGSNELKETKKKSALESFLEQLNDPLIYVLMAAAVISLLLHEISDAAIIAVVVCMNAVVGMIQEGKMEGIREGEMKKAKEMSISLANMGMSADKIAMAARVSVGLVREWLSGER